jgi:hypothetical protein
MMFCQAQYNATNKTPPITSRGLCGWARCAGLNKKGRPVVVTELDAADFGGIDFGVPVISAVDDNKGFCSVMLRFSSVHILKYIELWGTYTSSLNANDHDCDPSPSALSKPCTTTVRFWEPEEGMVRVWWYDSR